MFITIDNIRGGSGYAKAIRELAFAMSKLTDVSCTDFNQIGYIPDKIYPLILTTMPKLREQDVVLGRPYFDDPFKLKGAGHYIANFVLEGTRFPERAILQLNDDKFDQIWVPSRHVFDNLVANNVVEEKIRIVPHGYSSIYRLKHIDSKPYFTFLFVGGYTGTNDRKGADLLVRAFREEFKKEIQKKRVLLYLKINTSYGDASNELEGPATIVDRKFYSEEELCNLYNKADCYVCPSQGEGFDMTTLEAMACGLPAIHNSWGGQMDYINDLDENFRTWPLANNIVPSRFSPWDIGNWRKPDLENLKAALRHFYEDKPKKKKYKKIANWTWNKAAKKAIKCLEEVNSA